MIVKSRFLATAALCALSLVLLAGRVNAQNVVDGFSGHGVIDASGLFLTNAGSSTELLSPLATGGDYTIHLENGATITMGGSTYQVSGLMGLFQVYSVTGDPEQSGNAPDQRANTNAVTDNGITWTHDEILNLNASDKGTLAYGWSNHDGTGQNFLATPGSGEATMGMFDYTGASMSWVPGTKGGTAGPVYFGFDIALLVGQGQTDPFGNGVTPGNVSTGKVYFWTNPGDGFVPEPAFYQMAGFLSLGGLGLLKLRRRRKA